VGDKAFLKNGKPAFVVKIQTITGTNFYQVDCHGELFELPESALFHFSEFIDCTTDELSEIESKLDELSNITILPQPSAGNKKLPSQSGVDISSLLALRTKFLSQLEYLESKV
jgi:hypothetical protein